MKYLFYLGHPAHYHYISHVIVQLKNEGHQILLVVREKDVLLDLVKDIPFEKIIIAASPNKGSKLQRIWEILRRERLMFQIVKNHKPHVLIGTDIVITHIGKLFNIPSIVISEDDSSQIGSFVKLGYRFATHILAPASCDTSPYQNKQIAFDGYMEFNYLHPDIFIPEKKNIQHLYGEKEKYFILRFAQLNAFHDVGKKGISDELASKIISLLEEKGKVHITSERPLSQKFEKYRIQLDAKLMHHALFYSDMYIGDSQTMTAEAAILGTPAVRFNDFVGKLGYLEELEHRHQLTIGIPTSDEKKLIKTLSNILNDVNAKETWMQRKTNMFKNTNNVPEFIFWLLNNFPTSTVEYKQDPKICDSFKNNLP